MAFLVAIINKLKTKVFSLLISDNHLAERLHVTALQTTLFWFSFLGQGWLVFHIVPSWSAISLVKLKTIQWAKETVKTRKVWKQPVTALMWFPANSSLFVYTDYWEYLVMLICPCTLVKNFSVLEILVLRGELKKKLFLYIKKILKCAGKYNSWFLKQHKTVITL